MNILICTEIGPTNVKGTVPSNCHRCDAVVAVSPSSTQLIIDHNCEITCMKCAQEIDKEAPEDDPLEFPPLTEE
jgi:hypothetical protein